MKKFFIILGLLPMIALSSSSQQEFSDYLARKEKCEAWKELEKESTDSVEIHHLSVSPLEWPRKGGILKKVWQQEIIIFKPVETKSKMALVIVGSDSAKSWDLDALKQLAIDTSIIVAVLTPVPNQPFTTVDGKSLREDELMAFTWNQFLDNRRASALLLAPMCKSIKTALDTLQEWGKSVDTPIESFAITGKSKRAWASWLLAANDPRVELLISCSFNFLNFSETAMYQHKTLGAWPDALLSYIQAGFNEKSIKSRAVNKLFSIVDPYAWKEKLPQHKYLLASASDPFFIANATQFYLKDLSGVNELRFYPSADHHLGDTGAIQEIGSYLRRFSMKKSFPEITSQLQGKRLKVSFNEKPSKAVLWYSFAKTPQAMHKGPAPKWEAIALPAIFQDSIEVQVPHQGMIASDDSNEKSLNQSINQGVTAAFIEFHFADGFVATTEVALVH